MIRLEFSIILWLLRSHGVCILQLILLAMQVGKILLMITQKVELGIVCVLMQIWHMALFLTADKRIHDLTHLIQSKLIRELCIPENGF